jgi:hypothetical protein
MPSLTFKMEYIRRVHDRYHKASRDEKGKILDDLCRVCRVHRKHALRLLSRPKPAARIPIRRPRRPLYSPAIIPVLTTLWKSTGYLCAERLKAALPLWMEHARPRFRLSADMERQLLAISPRQMDRRLAKVKSRAKRAVYGTTKPGSLLKRMIPVRTDFWDVRKPGFQEIDLVSHSGPCASGDFLHTLNATDIQTTWVERQAVLGKSQEAVLDGLRTIESRLPFPLLGIDSDNGSEFINDHLLTYCQTRKPKIQFTRSREYKKDDNAHIEQKNWTHVRKLLGYERYDSPRAQAAINNLYDDLRLFQNLFQPSMKLKTKVHRGSRLIRRYDTPQTPFERLRAYPQHDPAKVQSLLELRRSLDPFTLSQTIDHKLGHIYALVNRRPPRPRFSSPPTHPFWNKQIYGWRAVHHRGLMKKATKTTFTVSKGGKAR